MRYLLGAIALTVIVTAVAILSRPLLPIDETRYVSVAWEAYATGDLLVSHINGATYAHKPPLLFWWINAFWAIFGVSDFAARAVGPLAGLLCLPLVRWISRQLWPEDQRTANFAPYILASFSVWLLFAPLTMFDTLLTLTTLIALCGILLAVRGQWARGWVIAGVGMGLGILTKGPVIFVHTLPLALLGGWWAREAFVVRAASTTASTTDSTGQANRSWRQWYAGVLVAVVVAGVVGLSWAIPSAISGGQAYADELLWGQTAGRVTKSFSHRHPFYWYLPILPLCLLPWLLMGTVWRGMRSIGKLDWGLRFLICWIVAPLVVLSLISGKQVHYLMPMLPACALVIAKLIASVRVEIPSRDAIALACGTSLVGLLPLLFNALPKFQELGLSGIVPNIFVPVLVLSGVAIYFVCRKSAERVVGGLASISAISVCTIIVAGSVNFWDGFRVDALAAYVAESKSPIVWYGEYHGQLNFAGRVPNIDAAKTDGDLDRWLEEHNGGLVVTRMNADCDAGRLLLETETTQETNQPTELQRHLIEDALSQRIEFSRMEQKPTAVSIFWIRQGLKKKPHVVLCVPPRNQDGSASSESRTAESEGSIVK